MRYGFLSLLMVLSVGLSACNGSSSDKQFNLDDKLYNMALARFGASISSDTSHEGLDNLIDGDAETFFESEPGVPILIALAEVEDIVLFELRGKDLSKGQSSNPIILIEFSEEGEIWLRSSVGMVWFQPLDEPEILCDEEKSGTSPEVFRCVMEPAQPIKFIRITTKADKDPYKLIGVLAAAWKK